MTKAKDLAGLNHAPLGPPGAPRRSIHGSETSNGLKPTEELTQGFLRRDATGADLGSEEAKQSEARRVETCKHNEAPP